MSTETTYGLVGPKTKKEEPLGMGGAALGDSSSSTTTGSTMASSSSLSI